MARPAAESATGPGAYDFGATAAEIFPPFTETEQRTNLAFEPGQTHDAVGIDEEVKVTKKRKPIAKLDEERLLSQPGIPKLRHTIRKRLAFKGKGHEYQDVARLLALYQLWLDDLYPRAKFQDGLVMIEKLGHKKKLQILRKDWINEGKAGDRFEDAEPKDGPASPSRAASASAPGVERPSRPAQDGTNPRNKSEAHPATEKSLQADREASVPPEREEMDLLDELLAEDAEREAQARREVRPTSGPNPTIEASFDDDMEAMAHMDMW